MSKKSDKILKLIESNYVTENDQYGIPSIICDNQMNTSFSLTHSIGRNNLVGTVKKYLIQEVGFDNDLSELFAEKFIEYKYGIYCDFVINM